MMDRALKVSRAAPGAASGGPAKTVRADDSLTLDYDARFLRRKVLTTEGGAELLVDLAETTSLNDGDMLETEQGRRILVRAAPEPLVRVEGADLVRLAWHVGNRHTPAQLFADHLLIRRDAVIEDMLTRLGARITPLMAPFTPEGGAYGHGRTQSHSHGNTLHVPGFTAAHRHDH